MGIVPPDTELVGEPVLDVEQVFAVAECTRPTFAVLCRITPATPRATDTPVTERPRASGTRDRGRGPLPTVLRSGRLMDALAEPPVRRSTARSHGRHDR